MGIHTTDAIILRQYPYRETSVLVSCLTDRFGKLKGIVKALRDQARPRYRSAMEPLTLNRLVFYDSRSSDLHLISQCDLLEDWSSIQRDLDRAVAAATCAELADVVVQAGDPQPQIFALLQHTLHRMAVGSTSLTSLRVHFMLRLLRLAGFHPQLDECTRCNTHPTQQAFWSVGQGGVLCEQCVEEDPSAEPIDVRWLELLNQCAAADSPLPLEAEDGLLLQHRLEEFLQHRLDRPLKTTRFLSSFTLHPTPVS